jgi:tight adherence protein B
MVGRGAVLTAGATASATLAGLAAVLLVLGSGGMLAARLRADEAWLAETLKRFSPNVYPVQRLAVAYNVVRLAVLIVLAVALGSVIAGVGIWLVLLIMPRRFVEIAWARRKRRIDEQIPLAVASMSNNIQAGLTLVQSIQRLAERAQDPIRTEFRIMANRYALGISLEQTLLEAKERLSLPNFNLFTTALLVNREMGGDVARTLDRISKSIEKLHQMHRTVEASTSEGRTNIKVLCAAPLIILLMLYSMDPEGVSLLFTTPQGLVLLSLAGLLTGTGIFWASKIIGEEL